MVPRETMTSLPETLNVPWGKAQGGPGETILTASCGGQSLISKEFCYTGTSQLKKILDTPGLNS